MLQQYCLNCSFALRHYCFNFVCFNGERLRGRLLGDGWVHNGAELGSRGNDLEWRWRAGEEGAQGPPAAFFSFLHRGFCPPPRLLTSPSPPLHLPHLHTTHSGSLIVRVHSHSGSGITVLSYSDSLMLELIMLRPAQTENLFATQTVTLTLILANAQT